MEVTIFPAAPCLAASPAEAVFLSGDNSCWVAPTLPAAALARLWARSLLHSLRPRGGTALQLSAVASPSAPHLHLCN